LLRYTDDSNMHGKVRPEIPLHPEAPAKKKRVGNKIVVDLVTASTGAQGKKSRKHKNKLEGKSYLTRVGFEPTPFRTRALIWRLRPLGHLVYCERTTIQYYIFIV
jgi:hypothetical protein